MTYDILYTRIKAFNVFQAFSNMSDSIIYLVASFNASLKLYFQRLLNNASCER